ncbi:hypothetical protein M758_UG042700 [Ceratodon purpureus]|nr:hypothetical protein M758_UG042700 [Ceratodon purpureus]
MCQCEPLKPKRNVWVLHPMYPNQTIAIGKSGPHWRSQKKVWIPNVANVCWEPECNKSLSTTSTQNLQMQTCCTPIFNGKELRKSATLWKENSQRTRPLYGRLDICPSWSRELYVNCTCRM